MAIVVVAVRARNDADRFTLPAILGELVVPELRRLAVVVVVRESVGALRQDRSTARRGGQKQEGGERNEVRQIDTAHSISLLSAVHVIAWVISNCEFRCGNSGQPGEIALSTMITAPFWPNLLICQ